MDISVELYLMVSSCVLVHFKFRWYDFSSFNLKLDKEKMNFKWVTKFVFAEAVVPRCSVKKVVLKILQNSQENTCAKVPFLITLQGSGLQICENRGSGIGVFL